MEEKKGIFVKLPFFTVAEEQNMALNAILYVYFA
jgi:hypothetical protein